jgi:hypothetical protein
VKWQLDGKNVPGINLIVTGALAHRASGELPDTAKTSASRGTFNGLATSALEAQGGDAAEQTAKNTAAMARTLGRVEDKIGVGGLVVG